MNKLMDYIINQRWQWREKREYIDIYDKKNMDIVHADWYKNQFIPMRIIKDVNSKQCQEFHNMFAEFADSYNHDVDMQNLKNDSSNIPNDTTKNKLFIYTTHTYDPHAISCVITCYPHKSADDKHMFLKSRGYII